MRKIWPRNRSKEKKRLPPFVPSRLYGRSKPTTSSSMYSKSVIRKGTSAKTASLVNPKRLKNNSHAAFVGASSVRTEPSAMATPLRHIPAAGSCGSGMSGSTATLVATTTTTACAVTPRLARTLMAVLCQRGITSEHAAAKRTDHTPLR